MIRGFGDSVTWRWCRCRWADSKSFNAISQCVGTKFGCRRVLVIGGRANDFPEPGVQSLGTAVRTRDTVP